VIRQGSVPHRSQNCKDQIKIEKCCSKDINGVIDVTAAPQECGKLNLKGHDAQRCEELNNTNDLTQQNSRRDRLRSAGLYNKLITCIVLVWVCLS